MSEEITASNYAKHFDPSKANHLAFFQALLDRVSELDPKALQEGGDLRGIWTAAVGTRAPSTPGAESEGPAGQQGQAGGTWASVERMAKAAGAKYPELVAAQWALESGWGKHTSGRHNYFGLKGGGSAKKTTEYVNGKPVTITDEFLNFASLQECVAYLVDRWYKDFKNYKGVNRAPSRDEAAKMLQAEGYATDPEYSDKLVKRMNKHSPVKKLVTQQPSVSPASAVKADASQWKARVSALNLSQPNASTCQAACIAMAVSDKNIIGIRNKLIATGRSAGDPSAMAQVIRTYKNVNYVYDGDASLEKVYGWLKEGELLITHGWFTVSGHVIILDGLVQNPASKNYSLDVKDPWSEFDGPSWSYNKTSKFFDGFYSENIIYAACVAGTSAINAASVYRSKALNRKRGGMWVHRFKP
jgi:hypothetical protein